jgi:Flp pilus assembly protein TadD
MVRETLERGLKILPTEGALHYALGLHYVRVKQKGLGIKALERAATLAPDDRGFAYGYAVGLYSQGDKKHALTFLTQRLAKHPSERDSLYLLTQLALEERRLDILAPYRSTLDQLALSDMEARQLREMLESVASRTGENR